ncbi:hypothetical protein Sjap_003422 [Stephania japonica]|uniref:Pentatricopeptide repeat-containing protein n=1 Tax=Stephania japonica TaxID=461633 RepID=A0AAP0KQT8_9MAGN
MDGKIETNNHAHNGLHCRQALQRAKPRQARREVQEVLRKLPLSLQAPIYQVTVRRLASAKRFSLIEDILESQKKYSDMSSEGFAIRLIKLYGESGMFDHARKVFDELPSLRCRRTVKSFNALLNACVDSKKFDDVERVFHEMPSELSVDPDVYSFNIMIRAFCEMGSLDSAVLMLDEMGKKGVEPNLISFNTLLCGLYDSARFDECEKVWILMEKSNVKPDVRSYNAKLRGLVAVGKISEAVELVEELGRSSEIKPDIHSFNALIKGFCKDGNLEEAKRVYDDLLKKDCVPIRSTFEALIPSLCENGDFDLAFKLCKESMSRRCMLDVGVLQGVVDGLFKKSKVEEAEKLVELARANSYSRSSVKMPS